MIHVDPPPAAVYLDGDLLSRGIMQQLIFDYEEEGYSEEVSAKLRHHSANLYEIVERATDEVGHELYEAKQEIHRHKKDGWAKWAESSECPFSKRHADRLIEQWEQKHLGHDVPNQIEPPVEPVEEVQEPRLKRTTNEEKRKTVEDFIAETPQWQGMSNREIARICGVSESLVRTIRTELEPEPVQTIVESTAHVDNVPTDVDNPSTPGPEPIQELEYVPDEYPQSFPDPWSDDNVEEKEEEISQPVTKSAALTVLQSSESNEWYTPKRYVDAAKELMGDIDLDPASCEQANRLVVKAADYYDITQNGLDKDWEDRVWLNPPYGFTDGKSNQEIWTQKLIEQFENGPTTEAVLLVNSATEAKWFQPLYKYLICFTDHRIHFYDTQGESNQPTQGNALVYFGPKEKYAEFKRIFSQFGVIGRFERAK